jgi:hypothetical protein
MKVMCALLLVALVFCGLTFAQSPAAVLISVSGRMPDAFYLQCMRPDTLIVILGIPNSPAPHLLPHEANE